MTTKNNDPNPWQFDVRVRERNLKYGSVTDKDVETYLTALPDLAEQTEPFATSQPALDAPVVEETDEDEDEDEEDDVADEASDPAS